MATLTLTGIRAHNLGRSASVHITGNSQTYVVFEVGDIKEQTVVLEETSLHPVWRDTVKLNLPSSTGELKVSVYNKRKLLHDHEVGSSHIDLSHLSKSPGAEVRMVLVRKGSPQGEISFMPEFNTGVGGTGGGHHIGSALPAGGGRPNYGDTNPAAHGAGLGGASAMARDKAAVATGTATPASQSGYASHVAALGATPAGAGVGHGGYASHVTAPGTTLAGAGVGQSGYASHVAAPGTTSAGAGVGHGEYENHDKPSGVTAGFGGGGAATFDDHGVLTGRAHPANRPAAGTAEGAGLYPTTGSSLSDPSTDLTNPTGDRTTALHTGAGAAAGLGATAGAGAAAMGGDHSTGAAGGEPAGGRSLVDKVQDTAKGAAASVQQGAADLKDRALGASQAGSTAAGGTSATGTSATGTSATGTAAPNKEFASALEPLTAVPTEAPAGSASSAAEPKTLLGRAQEAASQAVGAAGAAVNTVAGAPRAAYNTAAGATQAVYSRVAGAPATSAPGASSVTTTHETATHGAEGAKPTLTERAKGLTASAIDTTTHLLDQAKIHVTGHGDAPAEASKTMTGTALAYTAKAIDMTTHVLDSAKERIVGPTGGAPAPAAAGAAGKPASHALPEQ